MVCSISNYQQTERQKEKKKENKSKETEKGRKKVCHIIQILKYAKHDYYR